MSKKKNMKEKENHSDKEFKKPLTKDELAKTQGGGTRKLLLRQPIGKGPKTGISTEVIQ